MSSDAQAVRDKHAKFLFPCVARYYEEPIVLTEGRGVRVRAIDGTEYLDFFGGILTVSLGHCHPEVVAAIRKQVGALGHSPLYPTQALVDAAEALARVAPGRLRKSFFTNSGSEANETAVLLAKIYTGSSEIVAIRQGFAGRSHLAIALTGLHNHRVVQSGVPGVVHALTPYCYRCPLGLKYPSCEVRCARDIENLILTTTSGRPAALVAEPIQGVGGCITPPKEYFSIAVGIVRKYGGVFVCDEVQTGFGRTGRWFGIEHWGVEPDIMTCAKGIANGTPAGVTIARPEIADSWQGFQIATFGGNPVSMAAINATLSVMVREDVPARAQRMGARLREQLDALAERYAWIGEVRGLGLMQGIELVEDRATKEPAPRRAGALMEAAKRHGLLLGRGGLYGNTIRIGPPMLITETELDDAVSRLSAAFAEVHRTLQ